MVTYSRWNPSSGLYDYYEANQSPGMNDDLPVPSMPPAAEIGVPSTECGRPMPAGARAAGSGDVPIGLITPPRGVDLLSGGLPGTENGRFNVWWMGGVFVAGAVAWAYFGGRLRRAWGAR
jgi:hypothetical protein